MDIKEFLLFLSSVIVSIISAIFGYHKYLIQHINQKNDETDKRIDRLEKYIDLRDNEVKELIKDLKHDIQKSLDSLKDDLKQDICILQDRGYKRGRRK